MRKRHWSATNEKFNDANEQKAWGLFLKEMTFDCPEIVDSNRVVNSKTI